MTTLEPHITFQNWGKDLDGAGIVTGIINIGGRDVSFYGHDFTVRAGSIDSTNGENIARHNFGIPNEDNTYIVGWTRLTDRYGYVPPKVTGPETQINLRQTT